jgi:hypothetical protein
MVSNPYEYRATVRVDANPKAKIVAVLATGTQVAGVGRSFDNAWILLLFADIAGSYAECT